MKIFNMAPPQTQPPVLPPVSREVRQGHYERQPLLGKRDGARGEVPKEACFSAAPPSPLAMGSGGELSLSGAVLALVCTAVGAGIVAVPRALSLAGWGLGTFLLIASASVSALSLHCLFQCAQADRSVHGASYHALVRRNFSRGMSLFVELAIAALLVGAISALLLLCMHVMETAELAIGLPAIGQRRQAIGLLILALLLCLPRNFASMGWVNAANFSFTIAVVVVVCAQCAGVSHRVAWWLFFQESGTAAVLVEPSQQSGLARFGMPMDAPEHLAVVTSPMGALAALPMTLYVFFCQICAPQLFSELPAANRKHASHVGTLAMMACLAIYVAVGALGYAAFGQGTESDILVQLATRDPKNHWLWLAQALFTLVLLLSTPVVLAPLRTMVLDKLIGAGGQEVSFSCHLGVTASILTLAMLIALTVPWIDFLMGILGATCVAFLALTVPGLLTLRCKANTSSRLQGLVLVVTGLASTPLCLGALLMQHLHNGGGRLAAY